MTKYFLFLFGVATFVMAGLLPSEALAQVANLKQQIHSVSGEIYIIPRLIAVASYVVGTVFAVRALFALKGFIQAPDDNPVNRFIAFSTVSALLILLPYSIGVTQNTLALENASNIKSTEGSFEKQSCSGDGMNQVFCNLVTEISPFAKLLAMVAYVMSASLVLSGLLDLKAYGDDPSQTPLKGIIMKFVLAAMLISLPLTMNIFVSAVTGQKASAPQAKVGKPMLGKGALK